VRLQTFALREEEDVASTYMTLLGGLAGIFSQTPNVILLALTFAAALKALPSLYAGKGAGDDSKPNLISFEDWILFLSSVAGYLLTAGSGDPRFALAGLTVAATGKSVPSLLQHRRPVKNHSRRYNPTEDWTMLFLTIISAALSLATRNLSYATFGLVFAFMAKGLGGFAPEHLPVTGAQAAPG
jgi:hypothetical protein